jgi:hypothetical protein
MNKIVFMPLLRLAVAINLYAKIITIRYRVHSRPLIIRSQTALSPYATAQTPRCCVHFVSESKQIPIPITMIVVVLLWLLRPKVA